MFELKTKQDNGTLTYYLIGRVDTKVAPEFERDALAALETAPTADVVLDAADFEYTSSAGLRVLLKLRKLAKGAFSMINVSPEVYEILEMTGFAMLLNAEKKA